MNRPPTAAVVQKHPNGYESSVIVLGDGMNGHFELAAFVTATGDMVDGYPTNRETVEALAEAVKHIAGFPRR